MLNTNPYLSNRELNMPNPTRTFSKEFLLSALQGDADGCRILINDIHLTDGWNIFFNFVFMFEGKYYRAPYDMGATEHQCNGPWEYEPDQIEVQEVKPVEKTVIVYE